MADPNETPEQEPVVPDTEEAKNEGDKDGAADIPGNDGADAAVDPDVPDGNALDIPEQPDNGAGEEPDGTSEEDGQPELSVNDQQVEDAASAFNLLATGLEALAENRVADYRLAQTGTEVDENFDDMLDELNGARKDGKPGSGVVTESVIGPKIAGKIKPLNALNVSTKSDPQGPPKGNPALESDSPLMHSDIMDMWLENQTVAMDLRRYFEKALTALSVTEGTNVKHFKFNQNTRGLMYCSSTEIDGQDMLLKAMEQTTFVTMFAQSKITKLHLKNLKEMIDVIKKALTNNDFNAAVKALYESAAKYSKEIEKTCEQGLIKNVDNKAFPPTLTVAKAEVRSVPMAGCIGSTTLGVYSADKVESMRGLINTGIEFNLDPITGVGKATTSISLDTLAKIIKTGTVTLNGILDYEQHAKEINELVDLLIFVCNAAVGRIKRHGIEVNEDTLKCLAILPSVINYRFGTGPYDHIPVMMKQAYAIVDLIDAASIKLPAKPNILNLNNGNDMTLQRRKLSRIALESATTQINEGADNQPSAVPGETVQPNAGADVVEVEGTVIVDPEAALADIEVSPEDEATVVDVAEMRDEVAVLGDSVNALESLRESIRTTIKHGSENDKRYALINGNKTHNRIRENLNLGVIPGIALENYNDSNVALEGLISSIVNTIRGAVESVKRFFSDIAERRRDAALQARAQQGHLDARMQLIGRKISLLKEVAGMTFDDPKVLQNIGLWKAVPTIKDAVNNSQDFHDVFVRWMIGNYQVGFDLADEIKNGSYNSVRALVSKDVKAFVDQVFPMAKNPHAVMPHLSSDQLVAFAQEIPGNSALGVIYPNELYNERYQGDRLEEIRISDFSGGQRKNSITEIPCATEKDYQFLETMVQHWDKSYQNGKEAFGTAIANNRAAGIIAQYVYENLGRASNQEARDAAIMVYRFYGHFMYNAITAFNIRASMRFSVWSGIMSWMEESILKAEAIIAAKPGVHPA